MADIIEHDIAPQKVGDGGLYAVVPAGNQIVDLEYYLPVPPVARSVVNARTVTALTDYVARHRTEGTSIFADVEAGRVEAVIDYLSAANAPAHKAQRCIYIAPFSEEWKRWTGITGKPMSQEAFSLFIEENRDDIVAPDGATMLELAKSLDARKKVTFKSGIRLDNGDVSLDYTDETTATGGITGKLAIPTEITIGMPVFYGAAAYKVTAFFRYRIQDGKLLMWVDLHRMKHIRDAAFADIVNAVRTDLDGVPLYEAALAS